MHEELDFYAGTASSARDGAIVVVDQFRMIPFVHVGPPRDLSGKHDPHSFGVIVGFGASGVSATFSRS